MIGFVNTPPVTGPAFEELKTVVDGKQEQLTFDSTPTANSTNPVTSGGVQTAINAHASNTTVHITASERSTWNAKQNALSYDSTPTSGSGNVLTSGAVYTALATKSDVGHTHDASDITSGTLSTARLPTIPISKGGTGATTVSGAQSNLGITSLSSTVSSLSSEVSSLKTSVSNGKSAIASAITDMGGSASSSDSWNTLAAEIRGINTGVDITEYATSAGLEDSRTSFCGYGGLVKSTVSGTLTITTSSSNFSSIPLSGHNYYKLSTTSIQPTSKTILLASEGSTSSDEYSEFCEMHVDCTLNSDYTISATARLLLYLLWGPSSYYGYLPATITGIGTYWDYYLDAEKTGFLVKMPSGTGTAGSITFTVPENDWVVGVYAPGISLVMPSTILYTPPNSNYIY